MLKIKSKLIHTINSIYIHTSYSYGDMAIKRWSSENFYQPVVGSVGVGKKLISTHAMSPCVRWQNVYSNRLECSWVEQYYENVNDFHRSI